VTDFTGGFVDEEADKTVTDGYGAVAVVVFVGASVGLAVVEGCTGGGGGSRKALLNLNMK
jgi:hypothetical protein